MRGSPPPALTESRDVRDIRRIRDGHRKQRQLFRICSQTFKYTRLVNPFLSPHTRLQPLGAHKGLLHLVDFIYSLPDPIEGLFLLPLIERSRQFAKYRK